MSRNPFDDLAADYDRSGGHARRAAKLITAVVEACPGLRPAVVLDVGTGTGAAAFAALAAFPDAGITGIDLSPGMIDKARENAGTLPGGDRIAWIVGDALPLPGEDGGVDLVLCTSSLHFFPATIFADWCRVLRSGGIAAYTLPFRSTFRPGPRFADLLPAEQDRVPLADSTTEALDQASAVPGFTTVDVTGGDGSIGYLLRRD